MVALDETKKLVVEFSYASSFRQDEQVQEVPKFKASWAC